MGMFDFLTDGKGEPRTIGDLIEYAFADKEKRKMLNSVPPNCVDCKILESCRDKENGYKCRRGCLIINARETLPQNCKDCSMLYLCRDEYNKFSLKRGKCLFHRKGDEYKL